MFKKTYKYLVSLMVVFGCASIPTYAGIFSSIFKKEATHVVAKKVTKEVTETAVEETAKKAASKSAKGAATELIDETLEKSIKNAVVSTYKPSIKLSQTTLQQKFTKSGVKKALNNASSSVAKKTSKAFSKSATKNITVEASQQFIKGGTKKVSTSDIKIAEKRVVVEGYEASLKKNLVKKVTTSSGEKVQKQIFLGTIEGTNEEVEKILGKRARSIWENTIIGDSKMTKKLITDLEKNPSLNKAIKSNPELLVSYRQVINSPYGTDVSMLRYITNGAGKYSHNAPMLAKKWGFGDDIIITTKNGKNYISDKAGNFLGFISGDATNGYIINVASDNHKLLNLYQLKNTTYILDNTKYITDQKGRVIKCIWSGNKIPKSVERDKIVTRQAVISKNGYSVNGDATFTMQKYPNDEGGHIIALQNGGTNDLINIIAQSPKVNHSVGAKNFSDKIWRESEKSANRALANGDMLYREITISYPNEISQRASNFRITQTVNGKYDTLKGPRKQNILLNNVFIKNE